MDLSLASRRVPRRAEEIQSLREKSNDLLPVSQLPNEILSAIFLLARSSAEDPQGRKPPLWIAITYVCRRWRAVAIAYPSLWSYISLNAGLHWLVTFTERSMAIPVDVQLNLQGRTGFEHDLLTSVLPRTRTLRLEGRIDDFSDFLPQVGGAALILRHLILRHRTPRHPYILPSPAKLSGLCFRDKFTHLQSLELDGALDLTGVESVFFEKLTSFVARKITSADNIRHILRRSPNLETILLTGEHDLEDYIPTAEIPAMPDDHLISLSQLQAMEIRLLNVGYTNALLRGLNMPSIQRMQLDVEADWYSFQVGDPLVSLFARITPHIHRLEANTQALDHLAINLGASRVTVSYSTAPGIQPSLSLTVSRPHLFEHHIALLIRRLFAQTPLTRVRSLAITSRDRHDLEELSWREPLCALRDVETVAIDMDFNMPTSPILVSMFPRPVICVDTEPDPIPLPHLKQLVLIPLERHLFRLLALRHCVHAPQGLELVLKGCGQEVDAITRKLGAAWDVSFRADEDSVVASRVSW